MSRYALAKDAGVDNSWLRRFEMGKSGIRVETLIAIAYGLKIPSATIISAIEKALSNPEKCFEESKKEGKGENNSGVTVIRTSRRTSMSQSEK